MDRDGRDGDAKESAKWTGKMSLLAPLKRTISRFSPVNLSETHIYSIYIFQYISIYFSVLFFLFSFRFAAPAGLTGSPAAGEDSSRSAVDRKIFERAMVHV